MSQKIPLTPEEMALLKKMPVAYVRKMAEIKEDGNLFQVLTYLIDIIIDYRKNYIFSLNEDETLLTKHAYARGEAAFALSLVRLIKGATSELAKREELQKKIRKEQGGER